MSRIVLAVSAAALTLGLAASASAQPPGQQCIAPSQIRAVHPVNEKQVNVRVRTSDIYRIDLGQPCFGLRQPQRILDLSPVASGVAMCGPADMRLGVIVDGFRTECFVDKVTKLTPGEVAALAKRDIP
jgi:hypothetical protein